MNGLYLIGITNEINGSDKRVIIKVKDNDHEKNKITTKLFFY